MENEIKKTNSNYFKKIIIGLGIIGASYFTYNTFIKKSENNEKQKYSIIENKLSQLERNDRAKLISNYINEDSVNLVDLIYHLEKDKCINLMDYINESNKLNVSEKIDYTIKIYESFDRKDKFKLVKELTKNSIGF